MTIRLMSWCMVFPVIHPTREWVSQSGIFFPPFESPGCVVEGPGSEEKIQCKGNRWEGADVDEVCFPWFIEPELCCDDVLSLDFCDDVDEVSFF